MSQYDTEKFVQPPDPDLICCICQCVLLSPVESPCRHVFCNICITTWLNNHRNCPTCRRRIRNRQLKPVLPMVQNMINRLLMICDFRDNGCTENVVLELYLSHVEACGYRKIKCRYSRCEKMILMKDKDQHENVDCDFREKLCMGRCGLMIPVCMFDSHDCYEELQKFNKEKSELVSKLQEKVKELNDMTKKLQKEVDRLKEQLRRRRWQFPFGDSWDSDSQYTDSMYNYLTGSSYTDDQDSNLSSQDYTMAVTSNAPTSTVTTTATNTANNGFREYVIYPSRRPSTPPTIQSGWPVQTRASRLQVYDIRSPSPYRQPSYTTVATESSQVLDLSQPTSQTNTLISQTRLSQANTSNGHSSGLNPSYVTSSGGYLHYCGDPLTPSATNVQQYSSSYYTTNTTNTTGNSTIVNSADTPSSYIEPYYHGGIDNLNTSGSVLSGDEDDHHSNDEDSHHSDNIVYSLSESDSERSPARWWRSSRSSMSHHSEHHSDSEHRSRLSRSRSHSYDPYRSRSHSYDSYRSVSREFPRGRYMRFYPHTSRSRSTQYSDESDRSRSCSYDPYRRSRSGSYRDQSSSYRSYRSRSRSYNYSRSRSWSTDSERSRTSSRSLHSQRNHSRRQSSRSRSRSSDSRSTIYSIHSVRSSPARSYRNGTYSRSRSTSRSNSRSISRSRSYSRSISRSRSRSRNGSRTPQSSRSATPIRNETDTTASELPSKGCYSSKQGSELDKAAGEIAGTSGNSRTDDSTETDSDAGYNFKRKKTKVYNSSSNSDSGIGTELSASDRDQTKNQNQLSHNNLNNGPLENMSNVSASRKRKNSATDDDRETKRNCSHEKNEIVENHDNDDSSSDVSWVPSANDIDTDETISEEVSSESSYEVCVPKTVMEQIDEIDSEETDDTWTPDNEN